MKNENQMADPENNSPRPQYVAKKLTDWKNEPTVETFKQDYTDASSYRDSKIQSIDKWLDNLNVTGTAKRKKIKGRSNHVPKLIRKQAEWRYASLSEPFLSTDDIFNIHPITAEDVDAAQQNELVLNNQFNTKLNKISFIDEYVRTAVDQGTVIVRTGWDYEEDVKEVPNYVINPVPEPAAMQEIQMKIQEFEQNPSMRTPEWEQAIQLTMATQVPHLVSEDGVREEVKVIKNCPNLEICDYRNLTIDPSCEGNIDNAKFIIYSYESSLADLKRAGKFQNLDKINIENNTILGAPDHESEDESSFNFSDKPRKKFVVHEYWGYWDVQGDNILKPIVATYVGDVLIQLEENPFPDGKLPFVAVQYLPVRKSIYGEPDGELLKENQDVIGAVTRGMIDIMGRSANGQMGRRKDALDVTNRRKFDSGQDYEFNANVDPRQGFFMHTYPEIPQSAQYMLQMQNQDAESLTGVKAFSTGGGISGSALGNTATGVRSALDATAKRELGILRRLAEGIKSIGRKIIAMNAEFLDDVEVIRITNEEFVQIRRDDLAGHFDLRLDISTAEADNQKAEELSFMLQTTAQSMGPEFSQIILSKIAKLRKMPDLAKQIEAYQPQPDPIAQQKAQLEVELLKAQIANEYAKAAENNANAALDNAKAGNLDSDTDQKNLEFLEQESGVSHARDMDKMQAQARGNIDLENVKHLNKLEENLLTPKPEKQ